MHIGARPGGANADAVVRANIEYHSRMARKYENDQPTYRPENIRRVRGILQTIARRASRRRRSRGGSLLDLGCGTGFILRMAAPYFRRVVGVDITPAMLEIARKNAKSAELVKADCGRLPFSCGEFDVVAAYGFLHHLKNPRRVVSEAHRVLRRGGIFYADQDPNRDSFRMLRRRPGASWGLVAAAEGFGVRHLERTLRKKYGLSPGITRLAEYGRLVRPGFAEEELRRMLERAGFRKAEITYQWFLGQGEITKKYSDREARRMEEHLRRCVPFSRPIFKYLSFTAVK